MRQILNRCTATLKDANQHRDPIKRSEYGQPYQTLLGRRYCGGKELRNTTGRLRQRSISAGSAKHVSAARYGNENTIRVAHFAPGGTGWQHFNDQEFPGAPV